MGSKVTKRDELAQDIMDLYYQDFKDDNEGHFDIEFFIRQVNDTYSALLRDQYIQNYGLLRQDGAAHIELVRFDEQWWKKEDVEVKKDEETGWWKAELTGKIFAFPYDTSSCGIQEVLPIKKDDCDLVRSKASKRWTDKFQPETNIVKWWPIPGSALHFDKDCCKKVRIFYIPVPDKDLELQEGLADIIKQTVLKLLIGARDGTIVDTTNDSNPNKSPETESNKEQVI